MKRQHALMQNTKTLIKPLTLGGALRTSTLLAGPENSNGPWVVCLHGFPDNHHSFRHQLTYLSEAGFRIACPMLPGYEPQSQNNRHYYDVATVADQLLHWLDALLSPLNNHGQSQFKKVHLIGHDWGAIVGAAMTTKRPERFYSYTSLSIPYGLSLGRILKYSKSYLPYSWYIQFFQIRKISEALVSANRLKFIDLLIDSWNPGWSMAASQRSSIRQTLSQRNVLSSALAYYRSIYGLSRREKQARALLKKKLRVPSLMIQGMNDRCIPPALWKINRADNFTAPQHHERLPRGHWPHQEMPEIVNNLIIQHFHLYH